MKLNPTKYGLIILSIGLTLSLSSCSKLSSLYDSKTKSSTTGWAYNSRENGGFEYKKDYTQPIGPGLVYIPGGSFVMGKAPEDVMMENNNSPRRVTVSSFYMDETEIRNIDYLEYLHWLKRVFADDKQIYTNALPDTLVWRSSLAYNEPLVRNYLRFKAYATYPVVGVNWEQANDFCQWRTDRVNEKILIDRGILKHNPEEQKGENNFNTDAYLTGLYKGSTNKSLQDFNGVDRAVQWSDGILLPNYRLPTEAEWEYAAYGMVGNTVEERVTNQRIFPWDGAWVRNSEYKNRGKFLANFVRGNGDYMGIAPNPNDGGVQTVEVRSFWANDFGLFCMAGNVSEWVADVYRQSSSEDFNEFNPFRGNVFKKLVIDTLTNKPVKDKQGRLVYTQQTKEELAGRKNYRKADNRNYNDGDLKSRITTGDNWTGQYKDGSSDMYNQNKKEITSLVSDHARVYKGGSWKDRIYWLSPGTRRFLDQKRSTDDIGFRCAMSHVGKMPKYKNKK
jgi:gliding motility-associated lipoprotein GldJ